jgi:hypothetical protein
MLYGSHYYHHPVPSLVLQSQVGRQVRLKADILKDAIDEICGAVMIAYPMGLPEWDPVRQALEGNEDLAGTSVSYP